MKNFILTLLVFFSISSIVNAQNCAVTVVSTTLINQTTNTCLYQTVLNFDATNSNNASSITVTASTPNVLMSSVTNPGGITDNSAPFTFVANIVGNYTINYTVPCNLTGVTFNFNYDGPGGGDCSIASPLVPLTPLAITLSEFTYKSQKDHYALIWSTSQESNNKGFTVEKSYNGTDFEYLQFVPSTTGNSPSTYTTIVKEDKTYYRLVQEDYDGTESIVGLVYIKGENSKSTISMINGTLMVHSSPEGVFEQLAIINAQGTMVYHTSNINTTQSVDMSNLPKGLYFVRLINDSALTTYPVINF